MALLGQQGLLVPPLGLQANIKDLERLWLECSCYYAVFDDNVMEDTQWDHLGRELWDRREELSPYFAQAVGLPWPVPPSEDNPLKTAMGINWEEGLPQIVVQGIKVDGPKRLARWRSRIKEIEIAARRRDLGWHHDGTAVSPK